MKIDIKKTIEECLNKGLIVKLDEDRYKITKEGQNDFFESTVKLHNAMSALNLLPKNIPKDVAYKAVLKSWIKSFNGNYVASYIKLKGEVEPIGHKTWLEFETLEKNSNLIN